MQDRRVADDVAADEMEGCRTDVESTQHVECWRVLRECLRGAADEEGRTGLYGKC